MPVKNMRDAPIKKLSGAPLSLAQVNQILKVFDALEGQEGIENPWAVALSKFKKSHHKDGGKWVKNEDSKASAAASACDLKNLDRYHLVMVGDRKLGEAEDLRALEADLGAGIYALWSDELQSILAFAFEPRMYEIEEAETWVQEAMTKPALSGGEVWRIMTEFMAGFGPFFRGETEPVAGRSFDDTRRLVQEALDAQYGGDEAGKDVVGSVSIWILEMGENSAIIEWNGQMWAITYSIGADDAVTFANFQPVLKEWVRKTDGVPVLLHAFSATLGDGAEAEEADGLLWKELIHPGSWHRMDSGRLVEVTKDMIAEAFRAWGDGVPKYITVPSDQHRDGDVPVEKNRGFVPKLKLLGDALFGGFRFTDDDAAMSVASGGTADCSVFLEPNVFHPESGERYGWVLRHVLLTNDPLVQDLAPFGSVPASGGTTGFHVVSYHQKKQEVQAMTNAQVAPAAASGTEGAVSLTADQTATLARLAELGLSADDVQAMADQRQAVSAKARDLEITKVVRALEGVEDHPGVVQVDSTRHYPVVCAAVEKALKDQPGGLGLSATDEGKTGLDAVVLAVVNALPAEARLAVAADGSPKSPKELDGDGEDDQATDEQIEEFSERLAL